MHKSRYQGLIKDYDGGTVMECYVHPTIDFTRVPETVSYFLSVTNVYIFVLFMQHLTLCKSVSFPSYIQTHIVHIKNWKIAAQRKFILERIRATTSKSDKVVHPPLPPDFLEDLEATAPYPRNNNGPNKAAERALAIPGVVEAGWTMSDLVSMTQNQTTKDADQKKLKSDLLALVNKVSDQQ